MKEVSQVGFSQRIRLDWLDYTANAILAGNGKDEIAAALRERLRNQFVLGDGRVSGNRDKVITILTKVWVAVPEERRVLRDEGLDFLRQANASDRMLAHWCMCIAAYPFFGVVAEAVGRLLRLQGTASAAQTQRRLRERLGERETVTRAVQRVLRAYIDWGVLVETDEKGVYRNVAKRAIENGPLAVWVLKASLWAESGGPQPPSALLRAPRLFPFMTPLPPTTELEANSAFDIVHNGLGQEVLLSLTKEA